MSQRRLSRVDLAAFTLLILAFGTALALFSHAPRTISEYPPARLAPNLLERTGDWLAQTLYGALGATAYAVLGMWFVVVLLLLQRRPWKSWLFRMTGWLVLVPACALIAHYDRGRWPAWFPGPGGTLGAWLYHWMQQNFHPIGQVLMVVGVFSLGALLTLDILLVQLLRGTVGTFRGCGRFLRKGLRLLGRMRRPGAVKVQRPAPKPVQVENPDPDGSIPIHHHGIQIGRTEKGSAEEVFSSNRFEQYKLPPLNLLIDPRPFSHKEHEQLLRERAVLLEKTCADFGLKVQVVGINSGPVITQYEIALETGVRVHKITRLSDDLALNLKVPSVRIVAPIPGKNTVGIELPNEMRADVRLKEVMMSSAKEIASYHIPLFLGKDSEGRPLAADLADMPHLLIAGRTGTGKSVCMNAIILSILMTRRPDEVKMIMIDPKMLEMAEYGKIPHLMHPVVTDMKKAEAILAWAVDKMEERYDLLSRARVRNIASYNTLRHDEILRRVKPACQEEAQAIPEKMPFIVIFLDEMADLIMRMKKEVEGHIIRLAQKSRAAGIHLVVATQKPTVDVITGLIKSNLPARICFKVVNKSDSRVVLDEMGADKLLGKGDLLFLQPGKPHLVRGQGAYASDEEIHRVVEHLECDPCYSQELIELPVNEDDGPGAGVRDAAPRKDKLYDAAVEIVLREGRGSVSLLQRALSIGYGRAARLIDFMAQDGIVGSSNGSNARDVLISWEEYNAQHVAS